MIELVIKIPEDEYQNILLTGKANFCTVNAIQSGTILPKGHGRLKDVDAGLKNCMYAYEIEYWDEEVPTIIEADKVERR